MTRAARFTHTRSACGTIYMQPMVEMTKPRASLYPRWLIFRYENFGHKSFTVAIWGLW